MRLPTLFCILFLAAAAIACDDNEITAPDPGTSRVSTFASGTIAVYVHWGDDGIANKEVDILEIGRTRLTDENGFAFFRVPSGDYTVRVHDINHGGPMLLYIDTKVSVIAHERTTVDVVDCLPCD